MRASLIVAMTRERLIGREGTLPWHYPEDLRHFQQQTLDQTILLGRKSWVSLGQPLPRRMHLVVSRSIAGAAGPDGVEWDGVLHFGSPELATAFVDRTLPGGSDHVWVLGGSEVFAAFLAPLDRERGRPASTLPVPERLVVTWVPSEPLEPGDVLFPRDEAWLARHYDVVERRPGKTPGLEFVTYRLAAAATVRRAAAAPGDARGS